VMVWREANSGSNRTPWSRYLLVPTTFDNPLELAKRPSWLQQRAGDGLLLLTYDDTIPIGDRAPRSTLR
jgi:hypothetical protein